MFLDGQEKIAFVKIVFGNGLRFQAQIEDLRSKWCILERNSKNNITGRNVFLHVFTHGVKETSYNDNLKSA
jgi:hypothetical protein